MPDFVSQIFENVRVFLSYTAFYNLALNANRAEINTQSDICYVAKLQHQLDSGCTQE